MSAPYQVTSLQSSPDSERRSRMMKYGIAMAIRLICIGLCFVVEGWWLILPAAGAVFLPYIAVVVANSVSKESAGSGPLRPGTVSVRDIR